MSKEMELIKNYREKMAVWQSLLNKESDKREDMLEEAGDPDKEPENLRERLDKYAEDSGLREKQHQALVELKSAENQLFSFKLEQCEDPVERENLSHLARDYAGRITWLKNFLEEDKKDGK